MHNTFTLPKVGICKRFGWWLLPPVSSHAAFEFPLREGFEDEIVIRTVVTLRIRDRIRMLFLGRLTVETRTLTEFKPGNVETSSGMDTY